ncbi:MAG: lamin tail domain-containing protein [Myxococcales bacterium]|nr:lamin tail domain-containing protein [Myxococcales bacterium]
MPTNAQDSLHLAKVLSDGIGLAFLIACSSSGLVAGCSHEPLDVPCPTVSEGDLVVTEIHGPQSGEDQYGEWVEVYNATGRTIDLAGLSVNFIKLDGSSERAMFIRSSVNLDSGAYGVFGRQTAGAEPEHVDYGYKSDIDSKLFDSAAVEISSCGEFVDLAVYRDLPTKGSLTLNGEISPPTAAANDDDVNWCVDDLEDENTEQMGVRGTPQEENPVCAK